jgi:hypothetical protein
MPLCHNEYKGPISAFWISLFHSIQLTKTRSLAHHLILNDIAYSGEIPYPKHFVQNVLRLTKYQRKFSGQRRNVCRAAIPPNC